jgi:hypothetical protein
LREKKEIILTWSSPWASASSKRASLRYVLSQMGFHSDDITSTYCKYLTISGLWTDWCENHRVPCGDWPKMILS